MGIGYSPKVVTDGLVLALDAANPRSYVDSESTWYDLSGNNNHASKVNSPVFSSEKKGIFSFDGTSDFFTTNYSVDQSGSLEYTCCAFSKLNTITSSRRHVLSTDNGGFDWSLGSGDGSKFMAFSGSGVLGGANQDLLWHMHSVVWGSPTTYLYMDEQLISQTSTGYDSSNNLTYIGKNPGFVEYWNGSIGIVLLYSRALSIVEIKQNFNALRGRYGL